jgi:DNA polymerase III gamma/tau subunit
MKTLIQWVLKEEGIKGFPEKAIDEIIKGADGSPRQALVILDSVVDIQNDDDLIRAIVNYTVNEATVIELCRALLNKAKWKDIAIIIKSLSEEPEKVRYAVLGYMSAALLNGENDQAAIIIEQFRESFMYQGKAGLTYSAYMTTKL